VIINPDVAATKADFDEDPHNTLRVTSFFDTIQGEGPLAGMPSVFLRLAGCNFGAKDNFCQFCDTAFQLEQATLWTHEDLIEAITALPTFRNTFALVVTGGEPTLQHNLLEFLSKCSEVFAAIQIETNGTNAAFFRALREDYPSLKIITVVSPKASYKARKYAPLREEVRAAASCLKFVVEANPASPHHTIPDWALAEAARGQKVYVSPMAVYKRPYVGEVSSGWDHTLIDAEKTAANYSYAATYALTHGLHVSIQQHLFLAVA